MTDRYTDEIFSCVAELGGISVIFTYSRLVLDTANQTMLRYLGQGGVEMAKENGYSIHNLI